MRAAAIQLTATDDVEANRATAERLVRGAAAAGAQLVVLPEKWPALGSGAVLRAAAEPLDGPLVAWVVEDSRPLGGAGTLPVDAPATPNGRRFEERLAGYVRSTYRAKTLGRWQTSDFFDVGAAPADRARHDDAGIGSITDEKVTVVLPVAELFERLPEFLRNPDGASHKRAGAAASRTVDYVYGDALTHELRYKVAAPHGFVADPVAGRRGDVAGARALHRRVPERARRHGDGDVPLRLGQAAPLARRADGLPGGMKTLGAERLPTIAFHQTGEAALAAGHVREALAEFRRLDAQHPREALHACQIARAYLEAGLGAAARAEARRAVMLDPKSSRAQRTLGWMLEHDLVGRRSSPGPIRRGPRPPTARRWSLDADDQVARASLVILLEHDADGEQTFRPSGDRLAQVLALHRELRKAERTGLLVNQLLDLFYAERFKEVLAEKEAVAGNATAQGIYVAAVGATAGAAEAAKTARALISDSADAHEAMRLAGAELMAIRRYKPAAALLAEAAPRHANAEALRELGDRLRTTRRREELKLDDRTPGGAARLFFSNFFALGGAEAAGTAQLTASVTPAFAASHRDREPAGAAAPHQDDDPEQRRPPGHPRAGHRRHPRLRGGDRRWGAGRRPAGLLAERRGRQRRGGGALAGGRGALPRPGPEQRSRHRSAARRCAWQGRGISARARTLLDYAARDASLGTADEPLSASPLAALWTKGAAAAAREVRIAAAALLATAPKPTEAIDPLSDCRAHPTDARAATACAVALLAVDDKLDRLDDGIAVAGELARRFPQSKRAFLAQVTFLARAHRNAEARALLEARAAREPCRPPARERPLRRAVRAGRLRARREGAGPPGAGRRAAGDGQRHAGLAAPPAAGS